MWACSVWVCVMYLPTQQITGIPPEGLTAEEIEKMRKKFGVSFKFSKFVLGDNNMTVSTLTYWVCVILKTGSFNYIG